MITPVRRRKMSDHILEEIKSLIKDGIFPPDTKLPSEMELAKMFEVSRSPVREALSVLAASGLIESRQGGGSWVRKAGLSNMLEKMQLEMIDEKQLFELLELRTIIESEAAALAATRHTNEEIEQMEKALHAFGETMLGDTTSIGDEADYHFHQCIVIASDNSLLIQTIAHMSELYQKALTYSLQQNIGLQMKRESVYEEHKAIFEAIKNREPEEASLQMKNHLQTARIKLGDPRLLQQE